MFEHDTESCILTDFLGYTVFRLFQDRKKDKKCKVLTASSHEPGYRD